LNVCSTPTPPPFLTDAVHLGDCLNVLRDYPDQSIDLIVTSPPYADQRVSTYGGIKPDEYVDWFLPRAGEFYRVLKGKCNDHPF